MLEFFDFDEDIDADDIAMELNVPLSTKTDASSFFSTVRHQMQPIQVNKKRGRQADDDATKLLTDEDVGLTALMIACKAGLVLDVVRILSAGADVNARDNKGKTALMFASNVGSVQCVRFLLAAGALLELHDQYGFRALHLAIVSGSIECVKCLLIAGADCFARLETGETPEKLACILFETACQSILAKWTKSKAVQALEGGDESEYVVEKIVRHCGDWNQRTKMHFLVRWEGYSSADDLWLPWKELKGNIKLHVYMRNKGLSVYKRK